MKYILIFSILVSCQNKKSAEEINSFTENRIINVADTTFMIKDSFPIRMTQKVRTFSKLESDSLFGELGKGFKNDNYTPGCEGRPMKIVMLRDGIRFNLFYISCKQDYSKIIIRKLSSDTAFVSLVGYKEGDDQRPWFQEIHVFISDKSKKINYVFLDSDY